tara:strand:- start:169 stop:921 length:753 start_codon:yes stop_codon:yes gene_type:complete
MNSSFSDNNDYPSFCKKASNDDNFFRSFRSNPVFDSIVDVLNHEAGKKFCEHLKSKYPRSLVKIEEYRKNDNIGSPRVYEYDDFGIISPSTLRYVNILFHIEELFENLNDFNIVELGIGYGGQSRLINESFNTSSYSFIDLPEVLGLAKRYLSNFPSSSDLFFYHIDNLKIKQYDLFISNYAFTELRRDLQDFYLENVILKSDRGYMIYNDINPKDFNSLKKDDLVKLIPNSKVLPEIPMTSEKNCIIYW